MQEKLALLQFMQPKVRLVLGMSMSFKMNKAFFDGIPQVANLNETMKHLLTKNCLTNASYFLNSLAFDVKFRGWSHSSANSLMKIQTVVTTRLDDYVDIYGEELINARYAFMSSLLGMGPDQELILLLSLIAFVTPVEDENTTSDLSATIHSIRDHFVHLLKMYIRFKFGPFQCAQYFDRFSSKLSQVREIGSYVNTAAMRLTPDEIDEARRMLTQLNLADLKTMVQSSSS